jgi:hypothetical protein
MTVKRLIAILLFLPATAFAQDSSVPVSVVSEGILMPPAVFGSASSMLAAAPAQAGAGRPETRRRPSMVGYVDDSTIATSVRIRFEGGYGTGVPDRAEFFYGKCGCYRTLPTSLPVFDPNAAGPSPDGQGVLTDLNFQQLYLRFEYAAMPRISFFGDLPVRFIQPKSFVPGTGSFGNQSGISDLRLGLKAGLMSTPMAQVTAQVQFATPTGDSRKGLGTNHGTVEPSLLFHAQADKFGLEAEFGDVIPTGGSAGLPTSSSDKFSGNVIYYGIGPSFEVMRNGQMALAPVVELVGWHIVSGFQTGDPRLTTGAERGFSDISGMNIVNIKFGARILFNDRSSIYAGFGHALTDAAWYDNLFRLEYRMGF